MFIKKWFKFLSLTLALIITDQFFKIAMRYVSPEMKRSLASVELAYRERGGWIERAPQLSVGEATKKLFLNQWGLLTLLILLTLVYLFHKSSRTTESKAVLPYGCAAAGLISVWMDQIGVWAPHSASIQWLHLHTPLQMSLSWAEVYFFIAVILFFWQIRRGELV